MKKTRAARSANVRVLFVPEGQKIEAQEAVGEEVGEMKIVEVREVRDAVVYLCRNGGSSPYCPA